MASSMRICRLEEQMATADVVEASKRRLQGFAVLAMAGPAAAGSSLASGGELGASRCCRVRPARVRSTS
jgi:hypothetical protein